MESVFCSSGEQSLLVRLRGTRAWHSQAFLSLNLMQDQVDEVRVAYVDRCSVSKVQHGYRS